MKRVIITVILLKTWLTCSNNFIPNSWDLKLEGESITQRDCSGRNASLRGSFAKKAENIRDARGPRTVKRRNGYAAINLPADTDCFHKSIDLLNQLNRFINFDAETALSPPPCPLPPPPLLPVLSPRPLLRELIDLSAVINFAPKVSHV